MGQHHGEVSDEGPDLIAGLDGLTDIVHCLDSYDKAKAFAVCLPDNPGVARIGNRASRSAFNRYCSPALQVTVRCLDGRDFRVTNSSRGRYAFAPGLERQPARSWAKSPLRIVVVCGAGFFFGGLGRHRAATETPLGKCVRRLVDEPLSGLPRCRG